MSSNRLDCSELSSLGNLPDLCTLNVAGNKLNSLTSLQRLTALTSLNVSNNLLLSLSGLTACAALHTLSANANRLRTLRGLARCTQLSEIQVCMCAICMQELPLDHSTLLSNQEKGNSVTCTSKFENAIEHAATV